MPATSRPGNFKPGAHRSWNQNKLKNFNFKSKSGIIKSDWRSKSWSNFKRDDQLPDRRHQIHGSLESNSALFRSFKSQNCQNETCQSRVQQTSFKNEEYLQLKVGKKYFTNPYIIIIPRRLYVYL